MSEAKAEKSHRTVVIRLADGVSLEKLRRVLVVSDLRWVYAERMADAGLGTVADLLAGEPLGAPKDGNRPGVDLGRWEHGRAFGPDLEIGWWREGVTFRLRALSGGDAPDSVDWTEPEGKATLVAVGGPRSMVLYGTHDKRLSAGRPTWSEARVPRHLAYPVKLEGSQPPQRVALLGQDYARGGIVVLTRLVGVVAFGEGNSRTGGEQA